MNVGGVSRAGVEQKELLGSSDYSRRVDAKPKEPSDVLRERDFLEFFCKNTVVELSADIKRKFVLGGSKLQALEAAVKIAEVSDFYSVMSSYCQKTLPLPMDVILLSFLEVNNYKAETPAEHNNIARYFALCMQRLIEKKVMRTDLVIRFYGKFDMLLDLKFGNQDTRVHRLYDKFLADIFLTEKSRVFMRDVTLDALFKPIQVIFDANPNLENWGDEIIDKVAKIGDVFTAGQVKKSYIGMSMELYKVPLLNLLDPINGSGEFRKLARFIKFIYYQTLRRNHLSCFVDKKKVVSERVTINGEPHVVSLAWHETEDKQKIVKAITVSKVAPAAPPPPTSRDEQSAEESETETLNQEETEADQLNTDVYMFFQEVDEYFLDKKPNPDIPLAARPLYKLQLFENSPRMRLKKVREAKSSDRHVKEGAREAILKVIQNPEYEFDDATVHTAAWHNEELQPVGILIKMAFLLSSRIFYGQIEERIEELHEEDNHSEAQLEDLRSVYYAVFVMVVNEIISGTEKFPGWHQNELFKKESAHTISSMLITEIMIKLKDATLEKYRAHDRPGMWLRKSIMTTGYKNPKRIKSEKSSKKKETTQRSLDLDVCVRLFQKALATKATNKVFNALSYLIRHGMESVMQHNSITDAIASLETSIAPYKGYPHTQIEDIVVSDTTPAQKASLLFINLVTTPSAGIDFRRLHGLKLLGLDTDLPNYRITQSSLSLDVHVQLFQKALETRAGKKMLIALAYSMRQIMVSVMGKKKAAAIEPLEKIFEPFTDFRKGRIRYYVGLDKPIEQKASSLFTFLVATPSLGIELRQLGDLESLGIDTALLKQIMRVKVEKVKEVKEVKEEERED